MLINKLKNVNLILASGSPRRQQFFKDLGLTFDIQLKDVEEIYPDHLAREQITDFLAELKASAFKGELRENDLLVTSDTIVWHQNKAVGKPKDYDDAIQILMKLSDSIHEVITSVCFTTATTSHLINDITKVTFAAISDDDIRHYVDKFKPFDKAGAYGIQDWIGLVGISKIEGSYTNVVGLPTQKVYDYLSTFDL